MIKRFENKMVMLKALLRLLRLNQSLWQSSGPLINAVNELENLMNQIESTRLITDENHSGLVTEKTNLQNSLINKAFEIASLLHAWASMSGNSVLLKKVDFPISDLQRQRDNELASTCKGILALARENIGGLYQYQLNENDLNNLDNQINQYESGLPNHRISILERKAANEKIKELHASIDRILVDQLDRIMFRFNTTNPDFYTSYLNARKVVGYGTRHEKTPESTPDTNKPQS